MFVFRHCLQTGIELWSHFSIAIDKNRKKAKPKEVGPENKKIKEHKHFA